MTTTQDTGPIRERVASTAQLSSHLRMIVGDAIAVAYVHQPDGTEYVWAIRPDGTPATFRHVRSSGYVASPHLFPDVTYSA